MKKQLIFSLTLLTFIIAACVGQPTQTPPEAAAPTQAAAQPTAVPTLVGTVVDNTTAPATEAPAADVSFANDVLPIFANSCNECHGGKQTKAGLDLQTYASLMAGSNDGTVIAAGSSAESVLVDLAASGKMPKRGPKLTAEQIQIISDWINAGALNN
jgi:mono/diheme cytochrome c family protein